MEKAFTYMFKDNKIMNKSLILIILAFAESILNILGLIIAPIICGYKISCVKSIMEQSENYILPYANIKKNFVLGIKVLLSAFFGSIPYIMIGTVLVILGINLCIQKCFVYGAVLFILTGLICLPYLYFSMAFERIFAKTESMFSYFQYKEAYREMSSDHSHYLLYAIAMPIILAVLCGTIFFVLFSLSSIIQMLLQTTINAKVVSILFITIFSAVISIIQIYSCYYYSYLTAKCIKQYN